MSDLAAFAGRWHPLIVHVPIGVLLAAALLEGLAHTARGRGVRPAVAVVVWAGAVSAVAAAASGYLLGATGGYGGATFGWHERAGLAVAALAVASAAGYAVRGSARIVGPVALTLTIPAILAAGHLGGTLTHGEHYLTEHIPRWLGGTPGPDIARARLPAQVRLFEDLVRPVLAAKCATCHGGVRPAADLRLDSAEGLRKGGHGGPALVAGRAAASEMVRRVWLPPSHKDAMPPGGRHALTVSEAQLLGWWIDRGASFEATLADVELDPALRPAVEAAVGRLTPNAPAILAVKVPEADPAAVARVRALGVSVGPLATGTAFLQVHCTNVARTFGDEQLAGLVPLAPQVTWLSLSGTRVTDAGLARLSAFTNLTRLHLDGTSVTDTGLAALAGLQRLEYLNVYGTAVTDGGLAHLAGLRSLRHLYAWKTGVTAAGRERLQSSVPGLEVELGESGRAEPHYDATATGR